MTTLKPRTPYTDTELATLYPSGLQLQQVQILLRHGERTPVNARFQNAGLPKFWPYCTAAKHLRSALLTSTGEWDHLSFRRQLETISSGPTDSAVAAAGPRGETSGICLPGELTDVGRQTTYALGTRLRELYVSRLGFLPQQLDGTDLKGFYVRATPIPRALESVQQAFSGLYPPGTRDTAEAVDIVTRQASEENLFPNEGSCARFGELAVAFGDRAAKLFNGGPELAYVNSRIGKWMPDPEKGVRVDGKPRLSGVMDTINSTLAHGKETRLPGEFYDARVVKEIDRIGVEEWFAGYRESNEYRRLGIGALVGDVTARMVERVRSVQGKGAKGNEVANGRDVKFALSGCHDTTLAAILASVGAFNGESWPPYTSHIAVELFKTTGEPNVKQETSTSSPATGGLWQRIFGPAKDILKQAPNSRTPLSELSEVQQQSFNGFYVRLRYNDRPMQIPGCKAEGKHYGNDESICTFAAFKEVVDKITPKDWKLECKQRLGESAFPLQSEAAGY